MSLIYLPKLRLNANLTGPQSAPAVVMLHALGTHSGLWAGLLPHLAHLRCLTVDLRGHGQSDCPPPPYTMGALVHDIEAVMDHFALKEAVVIGVSLGGLVAQGLAIKRLDLVRGLVLSNTAAKIGGPALWHARIAQVEQTGLDAYANGAMQRMLGPRWQDAPMMPSLRKMLLDTPVQGWIGAAHAIAGADFYTPVSSLQLPTLVVAGTRDGTTPPDLVRETADLIPSAQFHLMRAVGHLPMMENPAAFAQVLLPFLAQIGHS